MVVHGQQAAAPASAATVAMLDYGHRPVVEVGINGGGPYRMILDTGATMTVVNPGWVGGNTGPTQLEELRIGALTWTRVDVGSQVPDDSPKGVLSAAGFPGYLVTFDYPGKTVSIRKGALPKADGKRVLEYGADEILPVVPIRVAGREFNLRIDTGSPGGVMLPVNSSKELPLAGVLVPLGKARTVAGEFDVFHAPVNGTIEIGEFTIDGSDVRFSDLRPGPKPGPGNFGYGVLHTFKVTFDAANRRLLFER
jgi:hypothetical protein